MGFGVRVECTKCESYWDISDGLLFARTDDGTYVTCAHPGEYEMANQVLETEHIGWFDRRLCTMTCLVCVACWEIGYYALTPRGIQAIRERDFRFPFTRGETHYPAAYVPADHVHRCLPFQCVSCRRWGPWLLWGEPLSSLLLFPFALNGEKPAPLPCPRCHRWGLQVALWIS